jgi:hypothetical protein
VLDLDLEPGLGDEILKGEIGQVGVEVDRPGPLSPDLDLVLPGLDRPAAEDQLVVEEK